MHMARWALASQLSRGRCRARLSVPEARGRFETTNFDSTRRSLRHTSSGCNLKRRYTPFGARGGSPDCNAITALAGAERAGANVASIAIGHLDDELRTRLRIPTLQTAWQDGLRQTANMACGNHKSSGPSSSSNRGPDPDAATLCSGQSLPCPTRPALAAASFGSPSALLQPGEQGISAVANQQPFADFLQAVRVSDSL